MPKIRISNPQPGRSRYTTVSQAERYVRRGEAVFIGNALHFIEPDQVRSRRSMMHTIASERRASDVYVKGTVWWDGDDPGGMHYPGEVVS